MKILIVDDEASRYKKLIGSLINLGISREEIEISICTSDARKKLENTKYDLLILDLLIPLWPESDPSEQHSEDLLNDLNLTSDYEKPVKIIGITANKDASSNVIVHFEMQTWQVVNYEQSCTEWITKIENCVSYLKDQSNKETQFAYNFDLAIICALDDPELSEVLNLDWGWSLPKPIDDHTFIYEGEILIKNKKFKVCATHSSRMGMVATANKTNSIINALRPKLIVMTGICGGIKNNTNFGDVIFAECVWDYQSGKLKRKGEDSIFEISPHQLMACSQARSKMELLKTDKKLINEISQNFSAHMNTNPRLILGPIATGAAVVADIDYVKTILAQNRKVVGIEMEIYGLYSAVENSSSPKPKVFALKSVCDFADVEKNDDYQKYCSYMSANILRVFIERYCEDFF
tara:strand:- start:116 stop:1333 length:1218 start_codon:yes stop_codon:yes gene_type:complete